MRKTYKRLAAGSAAVVAGVIGLALPASADPINVPHPQIMTVTCPGMDPFQVVGNGNGNWTPVHDMQTNAMYIPVGLGDFSATAYDADMNVIGGFTDPSFVTRHIGPKTQDTMQCTFTTGVVEVDGQDPEAPPGTWYEEFSGTAIIFSTPANG